CPFSLSPVDSGVYGGTEKSGRRSLLWYMPCRLEAPRSCFPEEQDAITPAGQSTDSKQAYSKQARFPRPRQPYALRGFGCEDRCDRALLGVLVGGCPCPDQQCAAR